MEEKYEDLNEEMYKNYYKHSAKSNLLVKIWSDALKENYPRRLNNFGFVTNKDLELITRYISAESGTTLLDIGCGRGGPGLWIAEQNKLKLTGIDIIAEAIEQANIFTQNFDLHFDAKFELGGFCNIPLQDSSIDNIISIDAFWMVQNKKDALKEIKRVLKKGGKFVFTTWDSIIDNPSPLFEECGFTIISKNKTEDWKKYQKQVYNDILKYKDELLTELGESARILISEASTVPPMLEVTERRLYHTQVR
ncbi:class I SAM-dependent methyltransferase [Aquimarina sp. Aq107]|uniref:class I SAM-dependent methyltransferase n=1 Tax=Aquimarina sp. Aq107 TaxID=1191912 RepID=UPI000D54BDC6|nr:class I SAM-dependent methyltransferase [Aquimarina sp. Aq107]